MASLHPYLLQLAIMFPLSLLPSMRKVSARLPTFTNTPRMLAASVCPRQLEPCPMFTTHCPTSCSPVAQLEVVGAVGSLIVWVLAIVILVKSCSNGLPQLGRWAGSSVGAVNPARQWLQMHGCRWCAVSSGLKQLAPF